MISFSQKKKKKGRKKTYESQRYFPSDLIVCLGW